MIKAWSPSKLDKYEQCPLACKLQMEDKLCPLCFAGRTKGGFGKPVVCMGCGKTVPEPEVLARGTRINTELDEYVTGERRTVPKDAVNVTKWAKEFREAYRKKKLKIQVQLAFTSAWKQVEWFDSAAWLRVSLDILHFPTAKAWNVVDWKTGKLSTYAQNKYIDQLSIYSLAVLTAFPQVEEVSSSLVFVDAGQAVAVPEGNLNRAMAGDERGRWTKRVARMLADTTFKPTTGVHCRWCAYSKEKGGPCPA